MASSTQRIPCALLCLVAACRGDDTAADGGSTDTSSSTATSTTTAPPTTSIGETLGDDSTDTGAPACVDASTCPPAAACHAPAECIDGACVDVPEPNGTPCDVGGDPCTIGTCDGNGTCVAAPKICNDPPDSPDLAACTPGGTFTAYLGGACGGSCDARTGECAYEPMQLPCPPSGTALPQAHAYQVVLRNHMAGLAATDFDVDVQPITYDPDRALDDEDLYRLWIAITRAGGTLPNLPSYAGVRVPSASFTLAAIEAESPVRAMTGRESPVDAATAWYTTWDYAGNPYFGSLPTMQRAFVIAAADMMTLDACNEAGNCNSGDWLAGALRTYATIGLAAHSSEIDACAVAAFDVGLRRAFDRLESLDYSSPNADIYVSAPAAMAYVAAALGDPDLAARAAVDSASIMATNCDEAGFCQHQQGGYDASYEGWSMQHLVEAALVGGDPGMIAWVQRFARLKAYTTVLEPDGETYVGPSHFSPATCAPAALDQGDYHIYTRDTAVAGLVDEGRYLGVGGRDGWPALPTPEEMREQIAARIDEANGFADGDVQEIPPWQQRHYPGSEEPGFRRYQPGAYATLRALVRADDPLLRLPASREGDYVELLGEQFAVAKHGGVVAMIHTGIVDDSNEGSGFGAGALSVVWSEAAGAAILGWNRGSQNTGPAPFDWSEARYWPTHALAGRVAGDPFSSARILDAVHVVDTSRQGVLVVDSTGELGQDAADPNDVLDAVTYTRHFEVSAAGVRVETSFDAAAAVAVDELFEILPISIALENDPGTQVELELVGGSTIAASPTPTDDVLAVVVTRFGAAMRITFDAPQRVAMADEERTSSYQWGPISRNLWIVLADGGAVTSASVGYVITAG